MKNLSSRALRVESGVLFLLDQTQLPKKETWIECSELSILLEAIRRLRVRGAPLIAMAAVCYLQIQKDRGASPKELASFSQDLFWTRPTAVNLKICLDRFAQGESAEDLFTEDALLCHKIAQNGATLVRDGDQLLTHCNTGSLATAGTGTAFGVIEEACRQRGNIHVFVDETRPLLQGARLTAWECVQAGIPHTLICDNMAASLMRAGRVDRVFVGADRITANGDVANKIGTYGLAALARFHQIPFYVVAPSTTFDPMTTHGNDICIETRSPTEVRGVNFWGEELLDWSPAESETYNPAFDVTPADLVEAYVSENGVFKKAEEAFSK